MRTLIITTGTSLLTNQNGEGEVPPWRGWRRGASLPTEAEAVAWLNKADPILASAETHTLHRLHLGSTDHLVWLASDTPEGRWCAQTLSTSLAGSVDRTRVETISGLTYHQGSVVDRGLRHLLQLVFDAIQQAGGPEHAILCATGGFKIETAYVSLIGLLRRVPVYYVHEQYRDLLSLPSLPIRWNLEWVQEREGFFRWIDEDARSTAEVASRLKADPDLRPLVQDDEEGNSYLSAAGWLLFRAFRDEAAAGPRAVWPIASTRTPEQKNQLSKVDHHRPSGWEQWVRRLTEIDCVESVGYEQAGHGRGGVRPQVYTEDPVTGELGILFGRGDKDLPLRVRTTARGEGQLALVRRHLESEMGSW